MRHRRLKSAPGPWLICAAALALLVGASPARAQSAPPEARGAEEQNAALSGRVLDAELDDYGVPDAQISVKGTDLRVLSDDSGEFELRDLPPGDLILEVEAEDYASIEVEISAEARGEAVVVELTWGGEEAVAVTTTHAPPPQPTASTARLSAREIAAAPHRNAEEILRQIPGLTLVQHGSEGKGHQFFLRGFDAVHGEDLALSIEGIPLNEWSNIHAQGYLDLGILIPEMVSGVEVVKGPFTLDQGIFAMAGSSDYRLGVGARERGLRAAYTVGTTNRHRLFAGYSPAEGNGEEFIGVEATHDDSFGENRELNRATFNTQKRLIDSKKLGTLDALALGGWANFNLPSALRNDDVSAGRLGFYDTYDPAGEGTSARGVLGLKYAKRSDKSRTDAAGYFGYRHLELLENFTGYLVDREHGDRRNQLHNAWSFGVSGAHQRPIAQSLALRAGAGLRGDIFAQREDNIGRSLELIERRRDLDALQLNAHALAGLIWRPLDSVQLDAGARLDAIAVNITDHMADSEANDGVLWQASPRTSARWQAQEFWQLFAAYGRGIRPPEARAFSSFKPEQSGIGEEIYDGGDPSNTVSDSVEIGTRWDPADWFGVSLAGFGTFIARESIFDHVSGINLELNATRRLGAEVVLYSDPLPWLSLRADLTYTDARFVESKNPVPLAPWLTSGAQAIVTHSSGLNAGVRALMVAPRRLPHSARGATLLMTDATIGYDWEWLRVGLELENLPNLELREGEYHYASYWDQDAPPSEIPVLTTTAGAPFNARLTLGVVF